MPIISSLVNTSTLLPHGFCINWTPALLWLYVISDALIVLAYYSIPITLVYFVWHRKDLAFSKIFMMFGAFILACGTTHLLGIITLWHPIYWIDASMKAFTALISVVTAIVLIKLIPQALKLPTPAQLTHEVQKRLHAYEDLKLSQTTLQESKERLSLAIQSNNIAVWDWNLQAEEMLWDDLMLELYKVNKSKTLTSGYLVDVWSKALHPNDRSHAQGELEAALNNKKPFDTEFRIIWPNGEIRHIKALAKVFFDDQGKPLRVLGTNIDITKSALVDQMKSEFIAIAAHELRTPMTTIFGYAELLKDVPFDAEEQKEIITTIHRQSKAIVNLLNDILDMEKLESQASNRFNFRRQAIAPILEELTSVFITDKNHNKVALDITGNLPDLNIDRLKIEQAIRNLLSNAYKFSLNNNEINMQVSEVVHEGSPKVLIAIQDHGIGMTPEQLNRVYEKFYRADKSGLIPGTGLGMAITKDIIIHHGGSIDIESKLGVGTKVMVYLQAS